LAVYLRIAAISRAWIACVRNMVKPRENPRNALKTLFVSVAVRYKLLIPQTRFRATSP
jgi:hypothetical protein